jgi:transcriptional regulator with XRE-family HTH domain
MARQQRGIADKIRAEIKAQKLSAYRVAKETGINEGTLSRFVNRKGDLCSQNIDKAMKMLGLAVIRKSEWKRK